MPHPIANRLQFDLSSTARAFDTRRIVRAVGDWGFVILSWTAMIALFVYPTLHVVALIAFAIWVVRTRETSGGRRCRDAWWSGDTSRQA